MTLREGEDGEANIINSRRSCDISGDAIIQQETAASTLQILGFYLTGGGGFGSIRVY
jgi:hypothetical protein